MWSIPDDPIVSCIMRTGYPYWIDDDYEEEEEEDREEEDEEEEEEYEDEEVDYGEN